MLASDIPAKFPLPWASSAAPPYIRPIPLASQIGIVAGAASLTDGFVPLNFQPLSAGGVPPWGADFNGIMHQVTQWSRWLNAGGTVKYDGTFSGQIGGYPKGAVIQASDESGFWQSIADNNATNPDTGGDGWLNLGILKTGSWTWQPTDDDLPGYVKGNGTTIGSAASAASQLANEKARSVYKWFWTKFSNTRCPVSGGRGASADLDFDANKTLQVLDLRGTTIVGGDVNGSTLLTGVPVTVGSATTPGSLLGENLHPLVLAENGPHAHSYSDPQHSHAYATTVGVRSGDPGGFESLTSATVGLTNPSAIGITINISGSGTPHNTVARSVTGTHYFHL